MQHSGCFSRQSLESRVTVLPCCWLLSPASVPGQRAPKRGESPPCGTTAVLAFREHQYDVDCAACAGVRSQGREVSWACMRAVFHRPRRCWHLWAAAEQVGRASVLATGLCQAETFISIWPYAGPACRRHKTRPAECGVQNHTQGGIWREDKGVQLHLLVSSTYFEINAAWSTQF